MTNTIENRYALDFISPPGETLAEILEERNMSQSELAQRMGRPKKTINEILTSSPPGPDGDSRQIKQT